MELVGVGAEPAGREPDMIRPSVSEKPMAVAWIEELSKPADPLSGKSGPLW